MTNEEWLKNQDKDFLVDMLITASLCKCCYYNYDNIGCRADIADTCENGIAKWLSMEHSEGGTKNEKR